MHTHTAVCSLSAAGAHLQCCPVFWLCNKAAQPVVVAQSRAGATDGLRAVQHCPVCGLVRGILQVCTSFEMCVC